MGDDALAVCVAVIYLTAGIIAGVLLVLLFASCLIVFLVGLRSADVWVPGLLVSPVCVCACVCVCVFVCVYHTNGIYFQVVAYGSISVSKTGS